MTTGRHNPRPISQERSFVLLAVLAVVIVLSAACVTISEAVVAESRCRQLDIERRMADDLLLSAEWIIADWLREDARDVVLPAASTRPAVEIFGAAWQVAGRSCSLRLVAWDQMGMTPPALLAASQEVQAVHEAAVPDSVRQRLVRSPAVLPDDPRHTSAGHSAAVEINLSTAPSWLLQAIYSASERDGLDHILTARSKGRPPGPTGMFKIPGMTEHLRPVATSSCWSIHIETSVGSVSRRWWFTYVNVNGLWRPAERLLLIE
jgi:hypothetical protein